MVISISLAVWYHWIPIAMGPFFKVILPGCTEFEDHHSFSGTADQFLPLHAAPLRTAQQALHRVLSYRLQGLWLLALAVF